MKKLYTPAREYYVLSKEKFGYPIVYERQPDGTYSPKQTSPIEGKGK